MRSQDTRRWSFVTVGHSGRLRPDGFCEHASGHISHDVLAAEPQVAGDRERIFRQLGPLALFLPSFLRKSMRREIPARSRRD